VIGNLNLVAALEDKDYDYKHVFDEGSYNANHRGTIFAQEDELVAPRLSEMNRRIPKSSILDLFSCVG
jgi:hypothetical protein